MKNTVVIRSRSDYVRPISTETNEDASIKTTAKLNMNSRYTIAEYSSLNTFVIIRIGDVSVAWCTIRQRIHTPNINVLIVLTNRNDDHEKYQSFFIWSIVNRCCFNDWLSVKIDTLSSDLVERLELTPIMYDFIVKSMKIKSKKKKKRVDHGSNVVKYMKKYLQRCSF